jgi:hypothetical protein
VWWCEYRKRWARRLRQEALKPLSTALRICKDALPEFVTETFCGLVEVPCVGVPAKVSAEAGFSVAAGAPGAGATAVPKREMPCGLPASLSATNSTAWPKPTTLGEYVTEIVQE